MKSGADGEVPTRRQWVGFWSMIAQQTQNAFNDKVAQFILIPLGGAVGFAVESWAGLIIALPFVLFAPLAGWMSDRFSKRDVMLWSAVVQVVVLGWICVAVAMKRLDLALVGFFALAVQSAFFSPAKIGLNKELLGSRHLGFAAGVQQMTAILGLLAGQIAAGWIFDVRYAALGGSQDAAWEAALWPLVILTVLALPALVMAWIIPRVDARSREPLRAGVALKHFRSLGELWSDRWLRRAAFGVAFFWGFAAFLNLWSVKVAKMMTGGLEGFGSTSSMFMAAASLGMAAGFGMASALLRRRIELGWVPLAGMAMTLGCLALAMTTAGSGWFLAGLALLAFSSAVFLAPLNAWMQDRYPAEKRGELQAAANLQNCFAGIIAVVLIEGSGRLFAGSGLGEAAGFRLQIAVLGIACGVITFYIAKLIPGDLIRVAGLALMRVIYRVRVVGAENLPAQGGVMLLPNHVSFADAFFLSAACPRPIRFVMDEAFMAKRSIRAFVSIFQTVTIRKDQPREAIKLAIEALRRGDVVCLFPEGQLTRTGTLSELRRGFELITRKAGHPLVPVWCDGAWGSIFSFERGRFFRKKPYKLPHELKVAFGEAMEPEKADRAVVRTAIMKAASATLEQRFRAPGWGMRKLSEGAALPVQETRRIWANGYQIGQVNALQRRADFFMLESETSELPGMLAFCSLFEGRIQKVREFSGDGIWVGGDALRKAAEGGGGSGVFYDFSSRALEPVVRREIRHFPCLAVEGRVISMSMEDPPRPTAGSEIQAGALPGAWGRLLPGWWIEEKDGRLLAHGPAGKEEGLALPEGCFLNEEGFVCINSESELVADDEV